MAFSRTYTFIYIGLVALLDNIQSSFSSITISTGYEPGARYNLYYEYSIYISRSRASKTLNHPRPSLFVTVATAGPAHKHTKTQHHHHRHHLLHTATTSTFTMRTETFKNDYRVIAKPTSFSSIPFPVTSIYQSDTTSPSQTAYLSQHHPHQCTHLRISKCTHHYTKMCHHHGVHSDDYKHLSRFLHLQLPSSLRTGDREKAYESLLITH